MTLFDDIKNSYLKLVEKIEMTFQHTRKPGSIYKDLKFRRKMEGAREFHMTKEDDKAKKTRLRQFPETFQSDLQQLRVPENNVFILTNLALITINSGWNKRFIVPRPLTVVGQRLEPRKLASAICCVPHLGEPLPPWVTFRVDRTEQSQDNFGGVPVCFTLDRWAEPFHLLDWIELIIDPKTNPTGATGRNAPRRLLLIDGYKFPINPDFLITCWLKNFFCVCIARHGGPYFDLLSHGAFARIGDLYADWIISQAEDEEDEQIDFKADPRVFTAEIAKFMTHSNVKKEIAAGWEKTCLFRSKDKKSIRSLIHENGVPEASTSGTSMRSRSRLRPQTTPERVVVNLISPEPSAERTRESFLCSPLGQQQPTPDEEETSWERRKGRKRVA